jgi:hypothetical protein
MKRLETLFVALCLALLAPACGSNTTSNGSGGSGGGGGGGGGSGGNGGGTSVTCSGATVFAGEANDYKFTSTISLPPVKVKPNAELSFDWSEVTADITRHAVDPKKDLKLISVLGWAIPLADLEEKMNADTAQSRDLIVVPASLETDGKTTSAKLFTFSLSGNPIDPAVMLQYFDDQFYPPDQNSYTVMASANTEVGKDIRMIQSFILDPTSDNTMVKMTKDSTKLEFTADLTSLTPTGIPAGESAITLDWSKIKKNALGSTFITTNITRALIGHYTETPAELSTDKFLDLELIAKELYTVDIPEGTSIDLSTMKDSGGNGFGGINDQGTWLVALQCGSCHNPAPWYLTVLKPCS